MKYYPEDEDYNRHLTVRSVIKYARSKNDTEADFTHLKDYPIHDGPTANNQSISTEIKKAFQKETIKVVKFDRNAKPEAIKRHRTTTGHEVLVWERSVVVFWCFPSEYKGKLA